MAKSEIDEQDLAALVAQEISAAQDYDQTELSQKRARAIEYLEGEMNDTLARPNGSEVTSRDLSDTIAWMLPGIMRVFMSSDQMAEFEPSPPDNPTEEETKRVEEYAEQASDYVTYVFMKDNDGYRVVYNATYDALTGSYGVVKHWWDDTPMTEVSHHSRLTLDQVMMMLEDEGVGLIAQEKNEELDIIQDEMGNEVAVETYNIKVERTLQRGQIRVISVPPENFLIDEAATCVEDARFMAHRDPYMTRSKLVEMGFSKKKVDELSADTTNFIDTEETLARHGEIAPTQSPVKSMERIDFYDCYYKYDVDGDGIAETVKISYVGDAGAGKVLDWEVWEDDEVFTDIPCYPRPHRFDGESVADRTMDIQQIKTLLHRGALDNLYSVNLPMREVESDSVKNPDILVHPKFGGVIWKKRGTAPIVNYEIPFVADKLFMGAEYFDKVLERRTGVSEMTRALDPEALQNQTATASQNARDAAYSQNELVARNMAELGWRKAFRRILKLVVKHQDRPRTVRLRGKFVEMDPRSWNATMDCTVNVGLGTGSKDRDLAMLNNVLMHQFNVLDRSMASGLFEEAADMIPKVIRTLVRIAEAAGLRNPDDYYIEFEDERLEQVKQMFAQKANEPPPEMQVEMAKLELQREVENLKAEGNKVKEAAQLEADIIVKREELHNALVMDGRNKAMEQGKLESNERMRDMDNATRIFIEQMKLGKEGDAPEVTSFFETLRKISDAADQVMALQKAPRRIVHDENGRPAGVEIGGEVIPVRREGGRIVGLG